MNAAWGAAAAAAVAASLVLVTCAAAAEPAHPSLPGCAPRERMVAVLTGQYGETVSGRGLGSGGALVEIWTSEAGSWTAVTMEPDGRSCIVAAGRAWQTVEQRTQQPGEAL